MQGRYQAMKKKFLKNITFDITAVTFLVIFSIFCIVPFYLVVVASFTSESTIVREGFSFYIRDFSMSGYDIMLKNPTAILKSYGTTAFVTIFGTIASIYLAISTGYVLSRKDFPWRNGLSFFFFFTTLFNGGLVPWYLWCSNYLGFSNSIRALILPMIFSVWNMIIAKNFIRGIPYEIIESVKIDGAGDFTIFIKMIIPLSTPLIATLGLFTALAYWNDWYNAMLYINNKDLYTLQYYLQDILNSADALKRVASKAGRSVKALPMESMKMAMTVIATGPILLLYPFLQKYFVKGLTIGALKG